MQDFWNQRYAANDIVYGKEPNSYFKSILDSMRPSSLLLPAEGEGRNAVYAASKGWDVTAFDYSAEAQLKANVFAAEKGVKMNYNVTDINQFIPEKKYDAIALIYVHLSGEERKDFHYKIANALAPGGTLILEAFSKAQIHNASGGPKSLDQLYSTEILFKDFATLKMIELKEAEIILDEGPFHHGKANVIRLMAKK